MKHTFLKMPMLIGASLLSINLWAQKFTVDGVGYSANTAESHTCTVIGYNDSIKESRTLSIPSTITYDNTIYSVMGIADDLFNDVGNPISCVRIEDGKDPFTMGCHNNFAQDMEHGLLSMLNLDEFYLGRDLIYDASPFDEWPFDECGILQAITIGEKVTEIQKHMFDSCKGIKSVSIPDNVKKIYYGAFRECSNLESVTLGSGLTYLGSYAFFRCNKLTSITIPNSVTTMYNNVFNDCTSLESATISEGLDTIGKETFRGCINLKSIEIPDNVTAILSGAFYSTGLSSIPTANGVTTIENFTYSYLSSEMVELIVPEGIATINSYCFTSTPSITKVELPTTLETMGSYNFNGDTNISEVYSKNPIPPVNSGYNFESKVYKNATLYVPVGSLELYKEATDWKTFSNIVEMIYSGVTAAPTNEIKVAVKGEQLTIDGANSGTEIAIYSANGKLIYNGTNNRINLPERGVYVVKVGANKPIKVAN